MMKFRFLQAGALGALVSALLLTGMPAAAQDEHRGGSWGSREARAERRAAPQGGNRGTAQREVRSNRAERPAAVAPRPAAAPAPNRSGWSGRSRNEGTAAAPTRNPGSGRNGGYTARPQAPGAAAAPARNSSYTAPRDRSYGAAARGNWATERQARDAASRQQRPGGTLARSQDRGGDGDRRDWGNRSTAGRQAEWRDNRGNYANRDGRRDDNRYGNNNRRWDNRGWRNDNRYDWHRYRAANRSVFSLGRYYSPYRNYSYSRINIGFRLGSLFYSNRYWINDPWQYRLPAAYGNYRWVRYYDDALLVDVYSGEVVDVIHNFFW